MHGIANKILGVVIALLLIILMLANVMVADQLQARRSIVAEVTNFVDEVTDTGTLTDRQIQDLYMGVNAYGPVCDVQITRLCRIIEPLPGGSTYTTYSPSDDITKWNQGDLVKVSVNELGYTGMSFFVYSTLHLAMEPVDFSFTGRIR